MSDTPIKDCFEALDKRLIINPGEKEILIEILKAYIVSNSQKFLRDIIDEVFETDIGYPLEVALISKEESLEVLSKNEYNNSLFFRFLVSSFSDSALQRGRSIYDPHSLISVDESGSFFRIVRADNAYLDVSLNLSNIRFLLLSVLNVFHSEIFSENEDTQASLIFLRELAEKLKEIIGLDDVSTNEVGEEFELTRGDLDE